MGAPSTDRMGIVKALIETHRLRIAAKTVGIVNIGAHTEAANLQFMAKPPIDPMRIIEMIQKNRHIKLAGNEKLRIERALPEVQDRTKMVRDVLRGLGTPLPRSTTA